MWRLIVDGPRNAAWNMALDEAILEARIQGVVPNTLRIYVFSPSAVSIGYFQKIKESVVFKRIRDYGYDIVRRPTGGGSVFHDEFGEITYSVIADEKTVGFDLVESYQYICRGLIETLKIFGIEANFKPINDVIVNGRKISGNAQLRRKGIVLQHGTLMYNTRLELLRAFLRVPKVKQEIKSAARSTGVTTISRELGRVVSLREVLNALIMGFEKTFGEMDGESYTPLEIELAFRLFRDKYSSEKWLFKR
ncbi:MAG: lipoate--protein ligase family protein [Thermoprotei archaeon]|nr:MAG: lipoate--protein ligase family protein [Thermoprotei archaeon]